MRRAGLVGIISIIILVGAGSYFFYTKKPTVPPEVAEVAHSTHASGAPAAEAITEVAPEQDAPTVEIPADKQQLMGVEIVNATRADFTHTVRTVGRIGYDEARLATISTKIEAWLERLYVNTTGMYIKKGDPVAELYSPELIATQQEYLNALKWVREAEQKGDLSLLDDARRMAEASRQRLALWDIRAQDVERAARTGAPVRTFTIHSPVSGYVIARSAVQGSRMMPGDKIVDIAGLSSLWVIADVYEFELQHIKPGMPADVTVASYPGRAFPSKVDFIYPTLSAQTRTAKVRLLLSNPKGELKPEMYANVELRVPLGPRLSVPSDAVIDTGVRNIIYVDKGDGYFEPREVTRGMEANGMIEIIGGLKEGEPVAASGAFLIDSEARLRGVVK